MEQLKQRPFTLIQEEAREQIKSAARDSTYIGALENKTHIAHVRNPLCGDEIEVFLRLNQNLEVTDLKAHVRGCLVARAGWSLVAPRLQNKTRAEILNFLNSFERELAEEASGVVYTTLQSPMTSLLSYRLPSPRHSCATLGSQAVLKALQPENCNQ